MYKIKFLDGTEKEFETLVRTNLEGADLYGANLEGATNIISFTYGQHLGIFVIDAAYVKIGCEGHSLSYWLENYEKIGQGNNYNDQQIREYGHQLKLLDVIRKERNYG